MWLCGHRRGRYDEENSGPDFSPAYGVQLHDPRLLEYVGAPEPARLLTRSPEYWLHHMGREKTLSAALQLQHDAGLILSNLQVLQQLVTAFNKTSSDVMRVVHDRRPFPTDAIHQVVPTYRVRRAAHYMTALGLWRPPTTPEIRGPLPLATCNACMSCSDCCPDVPQWPGGRSILFPVYWLFYWTLVLITFHVVLGVLDQLPFLMVLVLCHLTCLGGLLDRFSLVASLYEVYL